MELDYTLPPNSPLRVFCLKCCTFQLERVPPTERSFNITKNWSLNLLALTQNCTTCHYEIRL